MPAMRTQTIFEQAATVFDGWTDADTGARIRRIIPKNIPHKPGLLATCYHQYQCFLDGGRKVLLRLRDASVLPGASSSCVVDLATGRAEPLLPPHLHIMEVMDATRRAIAFTDRPLIAQAGPPGGHACLWDLQADRELATLPIGDWTFNSINFLSDGLRALVFMYRGKPYDETVQSRHYLLTSGEEPRLVMEADGYFCSHIQGCPTDPNLYTYDRWPSPMREIDQTITLRSLDGTFEEPVKLDAAAGRPGNTWGCRDHYLWTPDGKWIVSYYCPDPITLGPDFNHFKLDWWLSALDWRTGRDLAVRYPAGRWNGHMQITPDSRYIICGGGLGFDKLMAIDIAGIQQGWNEQILCSFPATVSAGINHEPFPYPFVLPDYSGVVFNAGWPGSDHGVYLAEWPASIPRQAPHQEPRGLRTPVPVPPEAVPLNPGTSR